MPKKAELHRMMPNVCSKDVKASAAFYTNLFQLKIGFESDWFVQLTSESGNLELGLIDRNNALVPEAYRSAPTGYFITFVVEDADQVYACAKEAGYTVLEPPTNTNYGQRRVLLQDPDGTLLDVSSPIKNFSF